MSPEPGTAEINPHRRGGMIMLTIAWLLIFAGAYWYFDGWSQRQSNPNTAARLKQQSDELVLLPNRDGHYFAEGEINGEPVTFLLDTGATQVALSAGLAKKLGLAAHGAVTVQTANGAVRAAATRLASIRLGPIEQRDIAAYITPNMSDDTVLLGMNFLKRLEFTQRNDKLILRQSNAVKGDS